MGQEQARHFAEVEKYKRQYADMEVLRRDSERESIRQVDNVKSQAVFNVGATSAFLGSIIDSLLRIMRSTIQQRSSGSHRNGLGLRVHLHRDRWQLRRRCKMRRHGAKMVLGRATC